MLSPNLLIYGTPEPPHAPLSLKAGPLSMRFEPGTGNLRRITLGNTEVLRGIYPTLRDRNWATVPPRLEQIAPVIRPDSFELRFTSRCRTRDIALLWQGMIHGGAQGTVEFSLTGEALTSFLRNRIGICVLHPIRGCAGAPARYLDAGGRVFSASVAASITPQILGRATFSGLCGWAHEAQPGLWVELSYEGDSFEMEDQRNWTDASFKTYCTPLAQPFPVLVEAGARISQKVTLRLTPEPFQPEPPLERIEVSSRPDSDPIEELSLPSGPAFPLPRLGVCLTDHEFLPTAHELEALRELQLAHLREDLHLGEPGWPARFHRAAAEAAQCNAPLELVLHLPTAGAERELELLDETLRHAPAKLERLLPFGCGELVTTHAVLERARARLVHAGCPIGAGSNAHFSELNRAQALGEFPAGEADFVSWPMTPQVHSFDNLSLVETLEAQPDTVSSARSFAGGKPLSITPITLRPRFNAVATGSAAEPADSLPGRYDPRQLSLFAAAWTLGSLAALTAAGAHSLTYFETTGWGGLMQTDLPTLPSFPAPRGNPFPLFHLFRMLAGFKSAIPLACRPPVRLTELAALYLDGGDARLLLLADLTGEGRPVRVRLDRPVVRVRVLHHSHSGFGPAESRACPSGLLEIHLPPHGLAAIEVG